jgi:hypothetical protein
MQALKLGVIEPFTETPEILIQLVSSMWTVHGDCLSRQYSGTSALRKHEKTAHKRQKLLGLVKNGVNSARRYKNAHIHDYSRQFAIDVFTSSKGSTTLKVEEEKRLDQESTGSSSNEDEESEDGDAIASVSHKTTL